MAEEEKKAARPKRGSGSEAPVAAATPPLAEAEPSNPPPAAAPVDPAPEPEAPPAPDDKSSSEVSGGEPYPDDQYTAEQIIAHAGELFETEVEPYLVETALRRAGAQDYFTLEE